MCDIDKCNPNEARDPVFVPAADRRAFIIGAAALPLAAVLSNPDLARAAAGNLQQVSIPTEGGRTALGVLGVPETTPAPTVLLIHEWWGLNDQIKAVANDFVQQGYIALAIDLYDGEIGTNREEAMALMQATEADAATDKLVSTVKFLREHELSTGKVGTVGWCFGGGWSLNTAIATDIDAAVVYYGRVNKSADELASLNAPVLGHFGTMDKFINADMVGGFEAAMAEAGKDDSLEVHWYVADHAFANPTGGRYDEEDAALSWARTNAFFRKHLG